MKQTLLLLLSGLVFIQLCSAESDTIVSIVPFSVGQNGQIIIRACVNNNNLPAKFYIETNGKNLLRSDHPDQLEAYSIKTGDEATEIDSLKIGSCLINNCTFRIANKLEKRGDYAFPDSILGTLGPELFDHKILHIDYNLKVIKIANTINALNVEDSTYKLYFKNDRKTTGINLELQTADFGSHEVAIDTRSPLGIHLYYSDLSSSLRKKHKQSFKYCAVKLDGISNKTFLYFEPEKMSLDKIIQINKQPVWFSDFVPNSIGNAFLNQFRVTIDFKKHILYLEPSTQEGKLMLSPL